MEDVRDILIGAARVDIRGDPQQRELYTTFRPLFDRYRKDMSPYFRDLINETYEYMGLNMFYAVNDLNSEAATLKSAGEE
eukprot:scaffold9373_cov121-Cylindrotheca_fusiformis.AAC.1